MIYLYIQFLVQSIEAAYEELTSLQTKGDLCLVIDGESLQIYMDHYQYEFIELAVELPVVVACRCSPTQKVLYTIYLSLILIYCFLLTLFL